MSSRAEEKTTGEGVQAERTQKGGDGEAATRTMLTVVPHVVLQGEKSRERACARKQKGKKDGNSLIRPSDSIRHTVFSVSPTWRSILYIQVEDLQPLVMCGFVRGGAKTG